MISSRNAFMAFVELTFRRSRFVRLLCAVPHNVLFGSCHKKKPHNYCRTRFDTTVGRLRRSIRTVFLKSPNVRDSALSCRFLGGQNKKIAFFKNSHSRPRPSATFGRFDTTSAFSRTGLTRALLHTSGPPAGFRHPTVSDPPRPF